MSSPVDSIRLTYSLHGQTVEVVLDQPKAMLGRSPQCDVVFPAGLGVSGQHAQLELAPTGWAIADLNSRNGTFVNGTQVAQAELHDGDVIWLGPVAVNVHLSPLSEAGSGASIVFDHADSANILNSINMQDFERLMHGGRRGAAHTFDSDVPSLAGCAMKPLIAPEAAPGAVSRPLQAETPRVPDVSLISLFTRAGQSLLTSENLDQMLRNLLDLLFSSFPCERGLICLYDEATDEMEVKATRTRKGHLVEEIKISQSVTRLVIKQKQSVLVRNTREDDRFAGAASIVQMNIRSAICAPLYHQGTVIGLIYLDTQREGEHFENDDLQLLAAMSVMSAVGIQQTQLRDVIAREQQIRDRLSRYSSPSVVDRIVSGAHGELEMAPEEKEVSVLFADLSGFTTMSENMEPAAVASVLNDVLARLTQAVFTYEGTVDKFIGDAIMAVFGAPLTQPDHAERAVRSALLMQQVLVDYNRECLRPITIRVGINSGPVVAGDIGSPKRRDYTVIGDTVNVASRLESSVAHPKQVVIGPRTYEQVKHLIPCTPLDPVKLKGKGRIIQPYLVNEVPVSAGGIPPDRGTDVR